MSKKHKKVDFSTVTNKSLVDIVIPVYGNFNALPEIIKLLPQTFKEIPYRIYIVDDASKEFDTKGKECYNSIGQDSNIKISYHSKNAGFAQTVNDGAKLGKSPYILVHSTDVMLFENAAKILYEQLLHNEDIGITSPKLLFPPNKDPNRPTDRIQHAGMAFELNQRPVHLFSGWDKDHPFANRVKDLNCVTGAVMMFKRQVFEKLGGFDVSYGKGTMEDVDICLRTRMLGYKIRYLPQAVGYHYAGLSAIQANEAFPVERNFNIFKAKFGDNIPYDIFLFNSF